MKILMVTNQVPNTPAAGGPTGFYDLMLGLKALGHYITVTFPTSDQQRWQQFYEVEGGKESANEIKPVFFTSPISKLGQLQNLISWHPWFHTVYRNPEQYFQTSKMIRKLINERPYDLVYVEQLPAFQYLPRYCPYPIVADPHDAISLAFFRQHRLQPRYYLNPVAFFQILKVLFYERKVAKKSSLYVLNSESDRRYLEKFLPSEKLRCIPNGVDVNYFHPFREHPRVPHQLIFTGSMTFPPNIDAALYFHDQILPLIRNRYPDTRFVIAGNAPNENLRALARKDPLTKVTGYVNDIRPLVWESEVYVCPLRTGTGVKNKVLNALAMAKPIVATTISCNGIEVKNEHHLLVADSNSEFADAVCRLFENQTLVERLSISGRRFVEDTYDCSRITGLYESLFKELVKKKKLSS